MIFNLQDLRGKKAKPQKLGHFEAFFFPDQKAKTNARTKVEK